MTSPPKFKSFVRIVKMLSYILVSDADWGENSQTSINGADDNCRTCSTLNSKGDRSTHLFETTIEKTLGIQGLVGVYSGDEPGCRDQYYE